MPLDERQELVDALKSSIRETKRLRQLNRELVAAKSDPIAIVSMSCRCAGGIDTPEALWRLLEAGGETIGPFPADRGWDLEALQRLEPALRTRSYGGFLDDISGFDPLFFGISPREAVATDPQQRLLLELSWEALERAGIDPTSLHDSPTGVFVGLGVPDFLFHVGQELRGMSVMSLPSVASGRISYTLGLHGPALTVDTACSSSLVTLHLACQSLRKGECDLALAGGATIMSTAAMFLESSGQGVVSSDGRCKPFGKDADGTVWGEAGGMLLLERWSDARRHGHEVLAIVRGSAVNQDGKSQGLTAPHGPAQEQVIRLALANAGLDAHEVDAVEGHGTGTALGDPIEGNALLSSYGSGRSAAAPLWLGSLKSNIGHTQAAAGVVSVIKMLKAFEHELLPRTLHVEELSPAIDWSAGSVSVLREQVPFRRNGRPRRVGVSGFGVSGTNAHVILEEPPSAADEQPPSAAETHVPGMPLPFVLSARSESALPAQAARLHAHLLERPALALVDVAHSLIATRSAFEARTVIVASERAALLQQLQCVAEREPCAGVVSGQARIAGKLAFVFSGQGAQWVGMARPLLAQSEVFARHMAACGQALAPHVEWSLSDVLQSDDPAALESLDVLQPVLFAVMTSLAALWRSYGVEPDAVIGHSQGEIAAAYVAGALSLADAARLSALRARLLMKVVVGEHALRGAMAAIEMPVDDLRARIAAFGERLSIAVHNGPSSAVVAGEAAALDELLLALQGAGVMARRVRASGAGHTAQVAPLEAEMLAAFADLAPKPALIPFYSSVEARQLPGEQLDAAYWWRNMRHTVRFAETVEQLRASGHRFFVEISAHPVLGHAVESNLRAADTAGAVVGCLRRGQGDLERIMLSLCELYVRGGTLDWSRVIAGGVRVPLPTYAFTRERYWPSADGQLHDLESIGLDAAQHPLLGASVALADGDGVVLSGRLSRSNQPWLFGCKRSGASWVPSSVFVEWCLAAAQRVELNVIESLQLDAPLMLPEQGGVRVQLKLSAADASGKRGLVVRARPDDAASAWTTHASAVLRGEPEREPSSESFEQWSAWPPPDEHALEPNELYAALAQCGLEYADDFRCLRAAYRSDGALLAEIELPARAAQSAGRYALHPALLEGALQLLAAATPQPQAFEVARVSGVSLFAAGATRVRARVQSVAPGEAAIELADESGQPLAELACVETRALGAGPRATRTQRGKLYQLDWQAITLPAASANSLTGACLVGHPASTALASRAYYPELPALRAALANGSEAPKLIVLSCQPSDRASAARVLAAVQCFLQIEQLASTRLVVLTARGFALHGDEAIDLTHAPVWGLVRTLQNEHPDRRFALLDWDGHDETSSPALFSALASDETQLLVRGEELFVPRLCEVSAGAEVPGLTFAPEHTVLITGATGFVGAQLARHLVSEHGARRLVVCARTSADAGALRSELAELRVDIRVEDCELQIEALLASIPAQQPLAAVFHLGAVSSDAALVCLDPDELSTLLAAELEGVQRLHELTRAGELHAFVMFSSLVATLGQRQRGAYAAACSFYDGLAAQRRCEGLAAHSVGFGLWDDPAGAAAQSAVSALVTPLSSAENLQLLSQALCNASPLMAAAAFDPRLLDAPPELVPAPLRGLLRRRLRRAGVLGAGAASLKARLRAAAPGARSRVLLDALRSAVSETLRVESSKVDAARALTELGMDSIRALELRNSIAGLTQLALPATLLFDHPSLAALAAYLEPRLSLAQTPNAASAVREVAAPLVALCTQARAAGAALRAPVWRLIDAATTVRVQSPNGRASSGLSSRAYALNQGHDGPLLIALPALVPPTGPGQYLRFAAALADRRDMCVLSAPGWSLGEALPADLASLHACLGDAALAQAGDREFVLCGWSSGGWLAHALTSELARRGRSPLALVMFDARQIAAEDFVVDPATGLSGVRNHMPVPGLAAAQATCDEELSAWTWYFELFSRWLPEPLPCPSLQFNATGEVPVPEMRLVAHTMALLGADTVIELSADHWSMMIDAASETARHVDSWLGEVCAKPAA